MDKEAGAIRLHQSLDYEKRSQFNFTVLAVDGGDPALTGSIHVTIFVDDANDNAPLVTSDLLLSVLENHSAGKLPKPLIISRNVLRDNINILVPA